MAARRLLDDLRELRAQAEADPKWGVGWWINEARISVEEELPAIEAEAALVVGDLALRKIRDAAAALVLVWDAPQPPDDNLDAYYEAGPTTEEAEQALRAALDALVDGTA